MRKGESGVARDKCKGRNKTDRIFPGKTYFEKTGKANMLARTYREETFPIDGVNFNSKVFFF